MVGLLYPLSTLQEARVAFPNLDNLNRWIRSGQADTWVALHSGEWNDTDWATLLEELKRGPFWPMPPDDVGQHLESLVRRYRARRSQVLAKGDKGPLEQALCWYVVGLAVVALASGFFAGASHTPIVGTLLPLLFALIGGGGGFYVVNADLSATATPVRLEWLGRALGLFGVACLVGSATGIILRMHHNERADRNALLPILPSSNTKDGIELAALGAKLRMLDGSPDEERFVLKAGADSIATAAKPIPPEHLRELAAEIGQLQSELKQLRNIAAAGRTPVPQDADDLVTALDLFEHQTEPWIQSGVPRDLFKNAVDPSGTTWADSRFRSRQPLPLGFIRRDLTRRTCTSSLPTSMPSSNCATIWIGSLEPPSEKSSTSFYSGRTSPQNLRRNLTRSCPRLI
jgi:hypothetical protein